jgi:hypothetical protein
MHLIGVYLIGVHPIGVHLIGMHFISVYHGLKPVRASGDATTAKPTSCPLFWLI